MKNLFSSLVERFKNTSQRAQRGYSDNDLKDYSFYLSNVFADSFRTLAKSETPCPVTITGLISKHKWKSEMRQIADTFRDYRNFMYSDSQSHDYSDWKVRRKSQRISLRLRRSFLVLAKRWPYISSL